MTARRNSVLLSTANAPDGWVLDSKGAIYDVRFKPSTTRIMNVQQLILQLLFVEKHPLVLLRTKAGRERIDPRPSTGHPDGGLVHGS